jgi:hypothetical protein
MAVRGLSTGIPIDHEHDQDDRASEMTNAVAVLARDLDAMHGDLVAIS